MRFGVGLWRRAGGVMKFGRFQVGAGDTCVGVLGDGVIHELEGVHELVELFDAGGVTLREVGTRALGRVDNATSLEGLSFLSPIATPPTVRDFYAFESHVRAGRASRGLVMEPQWYERPVFYFSSPYAVMGEGDVALPPGCESFDFELEVAAIIGAPGKNVTPREGEDLVIGYCVMNDWSARDIQQDEMKLSMGPVKSKDTSTSLGPWLVTKDELDDVREGTGYRLEMSCKVNAKPYAKAQWCDVYWSFGEMVSYAARGGEVRPGDVLGSGTCGTGCILELAQTFGKDEYPWLVPGDEVVASVERLGSLHNRVVAGAPLIALRK